MRRGFTLVEMMVVVGIIAMLMAALTVSYSSAQTKSRISKATAETTSLTQAIYSYENYVDTGIPEASDAEAGESSLPYLFGGGTDRAGNQIPVLFNGSLSNGKFLDPWGHPYRVTVKSAPDAGSSDQVGKNLTTGVFIPNRYGRRAMQSQGGR